MTDGATHSDELQPEEAFAVLGNDTRVAILRELGLRGTPMSFTELRKAVGIRQGGRFNYHLDKLVGHFVAKTDDGYALRQPGRAVVEAVLSGAVTHEPEIEPTPVEFTCRLCDAPIKVSYRAERVELYCTACPGQYGEYVAERESAFDIPDGYLGGYQLPPAGAEGRSPRELLEAASLWAHLQGVALANGLCLRCGGVVEVDLIVCEDHDRSLGRCPDCDNRHAIQVERRCTNCHYEAGGMAINVLATRLELRRFVAEQGIDPIVEGYRWGWDCTEEVLSHDPFLAEFTFEVAGSELTLRTDEHLEVVEVIGQSGGPDRVIST